MTWQCSEPQCWPPAPGVSVLAGNRGEARHAVVAGWLAEQALAHDREGAGQMLRLRCRPEDGGPWAGLRGLLQELVPSVRRDAPDLLCRHAQELCLALPELRSELGFPQSLTDTVPEEEKTRNYAADRAYRCLHGLVELIGEWHELADPGPWSLVCEDYDEANPLVRRFFAQLVRRRGAQLHLRLLVTVAPSRGDEILREFEPATMRATVHLDLAEDELTRSREEWTQLALTLDAQLRADPAARELEFPRLIDAWRRSDTPDRALRWELAMMSTHNHLGLYEVGLRYADAVEAGLETLYTACPADYFDAIRVLYFCYVSLDRAARVVELVDQALTRVTDPRTENEFCYLLAMLHARFLRPADLAAAEHLLARALDVLELPEIDVDDHHFLTVFTLNGLAFVRMRQGRVGEAIDLCAAGFARLDEHLDPDRHRLHRSVLLFNIAQVHAHVGPYEDAIDYLSQAMMMDPNYSEYYNDRGAVFFKIGRVEEAARDYRRAIELSPPYAEVWTNLGQCYRAMGRMEAAVAAYTRSLDLEPSSPLALVGRAEAQLALEHAPAALTDYDQALALEPDRALILAGRAIVHYECGHVAEAAADLDRAIALDPEMPQLYQNRAAALCDLGRIDEATRDLHTYLTLCPEAEDRAEVQASLATFESIAAAA
jgi:tetratricopeptide (TPR) repeat protein